MKYKIKEFYEKALVEGKFNSEFFKDLRKISTKVQLKNFIEEKIMPIAKEMGYDFSVEELLNYEKEIAQKVTEQDLENVSGGVNLKNLAFGGIISLLTMGAGIIGTISSAKAMDNGEIPQTSKDLLESDDEDQVDFSESREPTAGRDTAIINNDALIKDFEDKLEELLKELYDEFEQSIGDLYPGTQLILTMQMDKFFNEEQNVVNQIPIDTPAEKIIAFFEERIKRTEQNFDFEFRVKIRNIRAANMQVNDIIRRVREIFGTNIDNMEDPRSYDEALRNFDSLMDDVKGDWLHKFNVRIANTNTYKEIQEEVRIFEDLLYRHFRDKIWSKFKNPVLKRSPENVAILKRSYTHAVLRGDTPQNPYPDQDGRQKINKKPKLAQLLERDKALLNKFGDKALITPFGIIGIKKGFAPNSRLIVTSHFSYGQRYTEIAKKLDNYYKRCGPEATIKMLYAILNYLETPLESGDTVENAVESLNCRVIEDPDLMPGASVEERECSAALCGILMLCESGQNRSENGGKRERGVIKTLIEIIYFSLSDKPFAEAFGHVNPDGSLTEGFYTPSATTTYEVSSKDSSHPPVRKKIKEYGGSMRSRVLVGKTDKEKVFPSIPPEKLLKDEGNAELLALSSDSEKEYGERDVFEISERRYSPMDNPGPIGGCLWRILSKYVPATILQEAAAMAKIEFNKFVMLSDLGRLLNEINRLGHYNLALHVDVFDYSGNYSAANSGHIPTGVSHVGANVIYIALIYDSYDGLGHYVEKI